MTEQVTVTTPLLVTPLKRAVAFFQGLLDDVLTGVDIATQDDFVDPGAADNIDPELLAEAKRRLGGNREDDGESPPPPPPPPPTVELDTEGIRWDERIHRPTKLKAVKGGTWLLKRKVDPKLVTKVKAELKAEAAAAPADGSSTSPPPPPPPPPAADALGAPTGFRMTAKAEGSTYQALIDNQWTNELLLSNGFMEAVDAGGPPATPPITGIQLLQLIGERGVAGSLTQDDIDGVLNDNDLANVGVLAQPDFDQAIVDKVNTELEAIWLRNTNG